MVDEPGESTQDKVAKKNVQEYYDNLENQNVGNVLQHGNFNSEDAYKTKLTKPEFSGKFEFSDIFSKEMNLANLKRKEALFLEKTYFIVTDCYERNWNRVTKRILAYCGNVLLLSRSIDFKQQDALRTTGIEKSTTYKEQKPQKGVIK